MKKEEFIKETAEYLKDKGEYFGLVIINIILISILSLAAVSFIINLFLTIFHA